MSGGAKLDFETAKKWQQDLVKVCMVKFMEENKKEKLNVEIGYLRLVDDIEKSIFPFLQKELELYVTEWRKLPEAKRTQERLLDGLIGIYVPFCIFTSWIGREYDPSTEKEVFSLYKLTETLKLALANHTDDKISPENVVLMCLKRKLPNKVFKDLGFPKPGERN